jgi:hypothetical protein
MASLLRLGRAGSGTRWREASPTRWREKSRLSPMLSPSLADEVGDQDEKHEDKRCEFNLVLARKVLD